MAQSTAERTEAMRQRRRELGLVRGEFYARPEHHKQIKAFAAKLNRKKSTDVVR